MVLDVRVGEVEDTVMSYWVVLDVRVVEVWWKIQ